MCWTCDPCYILDKNYFVPELLKPVDVLPTDREELTPPQSPAGNLLSRLSSRTGSKHSADPLGLQGFRKPSLGMKKQPSLGDGMRRQPSLTDGMKKQSSPGSGRKDSKSMIRVGSDLTSKLASGGFVGRPASQGASRA